MMLLHFLQMEDLNCWFTNFFSLLVRFLLVSFKIIIMLLNFLTWKYLKKRISLLNGVPKQITVAHNGVSKNQKILILLCLNKLKWPFLLHLEGDSWFTYWSTQLMWSSPNQCGKTMSEGSYWRTKTFVTGPY